MTSKLLKPFVRSPVQLPPECFGKYVGSFSLINHCWIAKGSVRDRFCSELKPEIIRHLDGWFGSVSSEDQVTLSVYMIGRTERTASPTVLFISENDECRRGAREFIKRSRILEQYPGFKTALASKDPGYGDVLEQLASGYEINQSTHEYWPAREVFYERSKPLQPLGMPIYVRHGTSMRAATANAIRLRNRLFYLAPSHAFFDRLDKPKASASSLDDDFEIDSDSEVEYDSEVEALSTGIGSESPDPWSDHDDSSECESQFVASDILSYRRSPSPTFDAPELASGRATYPSLGPVNDKILPFSNVQVKYPPREVKSPPLDSLVPLGALVDWSVDKDWALIEVVENGDTDVTSDLSTVQRALCAQDEAKVITYTASGGEMTGTILGTPSYTRVPRGTSFQEVFSVNLNGPLSDGDCGSAVFDAATGKLFGHIVAGCRNTGFAYVMAAHHVFPTLETSALQIKGKSRQLGYRLPEHYENTALTSSNLKLASTGYRHMTTWNAQDKTCKWLLKAPQYNDWLLDKHRSVLWINGKPGAGKSILIKHIIDGVQEKVKDKGLISFISKTWEQSLEKSTFGIFQSLYSTDALAGRDEKEIWDMMPFFEHMNQQYDSANALRTRTREKPGDLHGLSRDILRCDPENRDQLLVRIQGALFASQLLRPEQLYFAIISEVNPGLLLKWYSYEALLSVIKSYINNSSKELAEITKSKSPIVQLVHESAKKFLLQQNGQKEIRLNFANNFQGDSHERQKQCCLSYMSMKSYTDLNIGSSIPIASSQEATRLRQLAEKAFPIFEYTVRKDNYGCTPLSWAARMGHATIVKLLLETGKVDVNATDIIYNRTPLFWATEKGNEAVIKLLLETGRADIEARDYSGQTPLLWAAQNGRVDVVKLLLEMGRADIEARDYSGQTALSWAARNGHAAVVTLLQRESG